MPADQKAKWEGVRTLGKLRFDKDLHAPVSQDSLYTVSTFFLFSKHILSGCFSYFVMFSFSAYREKIQAFCSLGSSQELAKSFAIQRQNNS